MHTIIFYDTKQYERDFFEQELFDKFNIEFKDFELLPETELSYVESIYRIKTYKGNFRKV